MFGRPARLPVDVSLGIPYKVSTAGIEETTQQHGTIYELPLNYNSTPKLVWNAQRKKRPETKDFCRTPCFILIKKF